jgi:hypothetical protein
VTDAPAADGHDATGEAGGAPATEGLAQALAHLQNAALSMVAAARAALDAAEQLARDPGPLLGLVVEATRGSGGPSSAGEATGSGGSPTSEPDDRRSSPRSGARPRARVEHIAVARPPEDPADADSGLGFAEGPR